MSPTTYRRVPVEVEAMRVDGTPQAAAAVVEWVVLVSGGRAFARIVNGGWGIVLPTREGNMTAAPGDMVVREPHPVGDRRFYPIKGDIFALTYEEV